MDRTVGAEIAALPKRTVKELQARYAEVFGEQTGGHNKAWLIKRIAWRLQALAEGDLSERARRRAAELANDADLRTTLPTSRPVPTAPAKLVRCAICTPKSTEEGLQQEFNTLDAQRESAEAYIKCQTHEGWVALPDRCNDGGFTGGNMDRPALRRLLADIKARRVDCVIVYKVDRLSRSLLDFARMMQVFDEHHVSFVSVTQAFNTGTSMGRLVLNVLLSFAQFEREIISERTRDKIAATRRKGKWSGGLPLLGYDVDPRGSKLVVNDADAEQVRAIFQLYLDYESLLPVVQDLDRRGWRNKHWQTRKGRERGGKPITRTCLYRLLSNVAFVGKIRYKSEVHDGEHKGIVDPSVFDLVRTILRRNGSTGGAQVRNRFGALLKGLLHCVPCGCAMSPTHTTRQKTRRYRYYVCSAAQKRGWNTCPSKSIPAGQIEQFVVDQIKSIGQDEPLLKEVFDQIGEESTVRIGELVAEQKTLSNDLAGWHAEVKTLSSQLNAGERTGPIIGRLAQLHERSEAVETRLGEIRAQLHALKTQQIQEDEARQALQAFTPIWENLTPREQARVWRLLVQRVDYDGGIGRVRHCSAPPG